MPVRSSCQDFSKQLCSLMAIKDSPRKYDQSRRAEQQAETRRRIVEAMVALHGEVGPASTTVSAIAERAGVERLTVYRHFADETAMFEACSAHYATQVVPPHPSAWLAITDPVEQMRAILREFYAYYRRAEQMLTHVHRDLPQLPALAKVMAPWEAFVDSVRDGIIELWCAEQTSEQNANLTAKLNAKLTAKPDASSLSSQLAAVVSHALRFQTWQSLAVAEGLGDDEAAELMIELARAAKTRRSRAH